MTKAIVVAFHKYTPFGGEFYEPILDFFIQQMEKYKREYHKIYFVDSTWNIVPEKLANLNAEILKVDPSLRYYDAYKSVLPQIKEDLVLFLDNDMVIYREGIISGAFEKLEDHDVVSIYDSIGTYYTDKLNGKNKFCPYFFATGKMYLRDFVEYEWGPDMPYCETLGHLTKAMLDDGIKPYEVEEDKGSYLFDPTKFGFGQGKEKGKDLGYYHIRAGSTPAYLLATRKYGDRKTYDDYLNNQPRSEYLRQFAWYTFMLGCTRADENDMVTLDFLKDLGVTSREWAEYMGRFVDYHGIARNV